MKQYYNLKKCNDGSINHCYHLTKPIKKIIIIKKHGKFPDERIKGYKLYAECCICGYSFYYRFENGHYVYPEIKKLIDNYKLKGE